MKRLIMFFAVAAMILSSEAQVAKKPTVQQKTTAVRTTYTVTGTVEGTANGDKVFMSELRDLNFVPVDSTTIRNGKFIFRGSQPLPVLRIIYGLKNGQPIGSTDFILENTSIKVDVAKDKRLDVIGGKDNLIWNKYTKQDEEISSKADPYTKLLQDSSISDEERANAKKEIARVEGQETDFQAKFIYDNIPSGVSDILLGLYYQSFDKPTLRFLLAKYKRTCPNNPVYLKITGEVGEP